MEPTTIDTIDITAYNLYYDYKKEKNEAVTTLYYFITHKESQKYNIFYKQAIKLLRIKKLNKLNKENN